MALRRPASNAYDGIISQPHPGQEVIAVGAIPNAMDHIQAYIEYRNIVGDADGGKLLSEEEYQKFRQRAAAARKNRIYVSWRNNTTGIDCKLIGPESKCFCDHRYRQHAVDNGKNISCNVPNCGCKLYDYLPSHGTWAIRCACKHPHVVHSVRGSRACTKPGCSCTGFYSTYSCNCGDPWENHRTVLETREERQALGKPVDNLAGGGIGYAALGGITSFSSLVDGHERLDSSGIGARVVQVDDDDVENASATSNTRAVQRRRAQSAGSTCSTNGDVPLPRCGKLTEEEEMAIYAANYERRRGQPYQTYYEQPQHDPPPARSKNGEAVTDSSVNDLEGAELTEAQRYALKKRLAMQRAAAIREERRRTMRK